MISTPKYTANSNRHTTSVSPLRNNHSGHSAHKPGKYFSAEEVSKIIKTNFEPKLQFLMQQLEDRQQIIARLNNKLNENDEKMIKMTAMLESHNRKNRDTNQWQSFVVGTINQLINDKTKQMWEAINGQIKGLGKKIEVQFDSKRIESIIQLQLQNLKTTVNQFIDNHKKKSNSYWQKIKDALNKINSKIIATQKNITDIHAKLEHFHHERIKDREMINELQNAKHVAKNLVQLRKSVENIYCNYQAILNLQKGIKQRMEQQGDSLWNEPDFMRISSKNIINNEDLIALQYSRQEGFNQPQKSNFEEWTPFDKAPNYLPSPIKSSIQDPNKSGSDIFPLQKTTPLRGQENSEIFSLNTSNQQNSKVHNSTVLLNYSIQARKQMTQGVRQRLLDLIQSKDMPRPIQVVYDQGVNYLKNTEGNYLFDLKRNMFKLLPNQLAKLENQGIISVVRQSKTNIPVSKVKRTNC